MAVILDGPVYVVSLSQVVVSTAITLLQIKAGSAVPLALVRARLFQTSSVTSAQARITILRKTAAATVTSFTPIPMSTTAPTAAAAGSTTGTGIQATAEGTNGNILLDQGFNVISGWEWVPTPSEQILVPSSGIVAMTFLTAPTAETWTAQLFFTECQ